MEDSYAIHTGELGPALNWPTCGHADGDGRCTGKQADGFDYCLAHLQPGQLDQALQRLHPGADLDISGTPISAELLGKILRAVQGDDERLMFGQVSFTHAHFTGDASFIGVMFTGDASFGSAQFTGDAWFDHAQFTGNIGFDHAQFSGDAGFSEVGCLAFSGQAFLELFYAAA